MPDTSSRNINLNKKRELHCTLRHEGPLRVQENRLQEESRASGLKARTRKLVALGGTVLHQRVLRLGDLGIVSEITQSQQRARPCVSAFKWASQRENSQKSFGGQRAGALCTGWVCLKKKKSDRILP